MPAPETTSSGNPSTPDDEFAWPPPSGPDGVDEELAALAPRPPGLKHAAFFAVVIVMSVGMMVWFWPEFAYLIRAFRDPVALGEAANIDVSRLESNSYVALEGIPRVSKTIVFNEGVKWVPLADTSRRLFPLAGQPRIFVQWKKPAEHKSGLGSPAGIESPTVPGYFEGHLLARRDMGPKFEKVWEFMRRELHVEIPADAWVLIDGETPGDNWWVIVVYAAFVAMIVLNVFKIRRIWTAWRS